MQARLRLYEIAPGDLCRFFCCTLRHQAASAVSPWWRQFSCWFVLASLGVYIVRVSGTEHQTVNMALLGARAFEAARTGVEWGADQALDSASCSKTTLTLTEGGLDGFDVDLRCSSSSHIETGNTDNLYLIDVEARAGAYGMPGCVSRRMQTTVADAPERPPNQVTPIL